MPKKEKEQGVNEEKEKEEAVGGGGERVGCWFSSLRCVHEPPLLSA